MEFGFWKNAHVKIQSQVELIRIFRTDLWLAGSTAANESTAMLENLSSLIRILTFVFHCNPDPQIIIYGWIDFYVWYRYINICAETIEIRPTYIKKYDISNLNFNSVLIWNAILLSEITRLLRKKRY